ncbi:MAG: NnrU family protein [Rhodospirillaceae bacterium]|nr:NnrU family protein [Rhodospirillaceae bacterium]
MIWLGIGLFFGVHVMPSIPNVRDGLIERMGAARYKIFYSLVSLSGMALIVNGYTRIDYHMLWPTPVWASHLALTVMPVVFILWAAAHMKGHIRKKLKHPMMIGFLMWSLVHLLNNGDRASLYLFGSFAVYCVFSIISSTRRGKLPDYVVQSAKHDVRAVIAGLVLFGGVLWGHGFLFGVAPTF